MDKTNWSILAKYLNEELRAEDRRKVEASNEMDQELKKEVMQWWPWQMDDTGIRLSEEEKEDSWRKVLSDIDTVSPFHEVALQSWISKAAATVLLLLGVYMLWPAGSNVVTTKDQKSEIRLADGSKVFLNQSSVLQYPKSFGKHGRLVQLKGEAFFQVKENPELPFVIRTGATTISVLGTSFNVFSRKATDRIEVTVVTGEVLFSVANRHETITPGEMGIYDRKREQLYKISLDEFNTLAWHSRKLEFKSTPFAEIENTLEKVFEVDIVADNPEIYNCSVTSVIHFNDLNEVLEVLQLTMGFTYEIEQDKIQISGDGCK